MASYDTPGVLYDSGVFYDDVAPPPTPRKHMAKIKLNLNNLTEAATLQLANNIKTGLTGNANFTTPLPSLAAGTTIIATATTKVNDASIAQQTAKMKTSDKDVAMDALRTLLTQWGGYVEIASNGDAVKIQSANIDIKGSKTPTTIPDQVMNLAVTSGDMDGEVDAQWDPVAFAKTYNVQTSPDPFTANSWVSRPDVTKSKTSLLGLTSGQRIWLRVRATGAGGQGAWSDPATKIVP